MRTVIKGGLFKEWPINFCELELSNVLKTEHLFIYLFIFFVTFLVA